MMLPTSMYHSVVEKQNNRMLQPTCSSSMMDLCVGYWVPDLPFHFRRVSGKCTLWFSQHQTLVQNDCVNVKGIVQRLLRDCG
jgi:hypothetical protein